ncbi:hypothetical protein SLEP1_g13300 [Rubroshorea leprosula]|uniref:Uncharacterized protein n=1 Tax=Rubroshorea leprosula TaxID=152421 RepID=A0AAV5IFD1_9ROSI|nr:hypothetical protein SLEP1_g13300 [Rubroshorea leprosula]
MAGSAGGMGSSNASSNPSAPKILLAKPSAEPVPGKFGLEAPMMERRNIAPVFLQLVPSISSLTHGSFISIGSSL